MVRSPEVRPGETRILDPYLNIMGASHASHPHFLTSRRKYVGSTLSNKTLWPASTNIDTAKSGLGTSTNWKDMMNEVSLSIFVLTVARRSPRLTMTPPFATSYSIPDLGRVQQRQIPGQMRRHNNVRGTGVNGENNPFPFRHLRRGQ